MKSLFLAWLLTGTLIVSLGVYHRTSSSTDEVLTPQEPEFAAQVLPEYLSWQRPDGPPRVALQVGHWKNKELPDEFQRLRETGGGANAGGKAEWEVNLAIAERTAELLRAKGVVVKILPATIPPSYWADVFVSIHADGNENTAVSGYKVAAPWRDVTNQADELAALLDHEYAAATRLVKDPNITRNMRGYYAFNWRRYEHTLHLMTVAAIIETGFLTNSQDRKIIVNQPELSAQGIARGILAFLKTPGPL